ncbi:MAG TPA: hypothetical protein VE423_11235 [Microvirga sp.]|jgi:hypothetical protein|nr:hypothetical protein [Microvirga sp.]
MSKATRHSVKASSTKAHQVAEDTAGPDQAGQGAVSAAETVQYIAEFTAELSFLARQSQLNLLAYLLDVARLEAIRTMRSNDRKR